MKKNKTKYIFECMAPSELTEFNKGYNKNIEDHCERSTKFSPQLECLAYAGDSPCKYLKIHVYKGDK